MKLNVKKACMLLINLTFPPLSCFAGRALQRGVSAALTAGQPGSGEQPPQGHGRAGEGGGAAAGGRDPCSKGAVAVGRGGARRKRDKTHGKH